MTKKHKYDNGDHEYLGAKHDSVLFRFQTEMKVRGYATAPWKGEVKKPITAKERYRTDVKRVIIDHYEHKDDYCIFVEARKGREKIGVSVRAKTKDLIAEMGLNR